MKGDNSFLEVRLRPLLGLVASLAMVVTFAAYAGSNPDAAPQTKAAGPKATPAAKADNANNHQTVYAWSASRGDSGIKLRGSVPSEEDRKTVLGMVKAHFPELQVEDKLKVTKGGPPKEQWLGAVSFSLQQLSHLKRGAVRLSNVTLRVAGEASSPNDYSELKKALAGPLPSGLALRNDDVQPPVADPFVFTADLGANAVSLSGSVPSEDARKQLRELSRQLFERPGIDDQLKVASGAPKNWDAAVTAALRALSRLESGKVALSGLAVTIEGVAPDKGTAVAVSYQLRRDLPKLFSTSESIKWKEASASRDIAAQVLPRIKDHARTNSNWPKGELPPLLPLVDSQ
jgi:hypothetical protein